MVLLSPLTLVSGKLQQLRLPGRGCSRDDRALWRVWMPVCVRASPRAPELPRGNCVPPAERGSQPAPQVARAAGPALPSPPPAASHPLPAAPPSCRCALLPRRGRPRHARSPEVPLSALPHLSRLPRVTSTAWSPSRPLPLLARLLSRASLGPGPSSPRAGRDSGGRCHIPPTLPEQRALPYPRPA